MIPVQISTEVAGKTYTVTLRCVMNSKEFVRTAKGEVTAGESRQRIELLAVLAGLDRMVKPSDITIKGTGYVKTGFEYLGVWKEAGWVRQNKKPVANRDLWEKIYEKSRQHKITIFVV